MNVFEGAAPDADTFFNWEGEAYLLELTDADRVSFEALGAALAKHGVIAQPWYETPIIDPMCLSYHGSYKYKRYLIQKVADDTRIIACTYATRLTTDLEGRVSEQQQRSRFRGRRREV